MKTQLLKELNKIKNERIRSITEKILNGVPLYFWDPNIGASSSGKYHLEINGKVESLIDHTKRVFFIGRLLTSNPIFDNILTDDEKDCILSALLLHDSVKRGLDLENISHTKFSHPILVRVVAKDVLSKEEYEDSFTQLILSNVESHSGPWNVSKYNKDEKPLPLPKTFSQLLCHLCDYIASRKGVYVDAEQGEY